jgi:hypothetical protein
VLLRVLHVEWLAPLCDDWRAEQLMAVAERCPHMWHGRKCELSVSKNRRQLPLELLLATCMLLAPLRKGPDAFGGLCDPTACRLRRWRRRCFTRMALTNHRGSRHLRSCTGKNVGGAGRNPAIQCDSVATDARPRCSFKWAGGARGTGAPSATRERQSCAL